MKAIEAVERALAVSSARRTEVPGYRLYESIHTQLLYIKAVLDGTEPNRSRMRDIIVGVYAVRELEDSDPEFARVLAGPQYIASQMVKGLKIIESELDRSGLSIGQR